MKKITGILLGVAITLVPAMAQRVPVQVAPLQKTSESRHALTEAKSVSSEKSLKMVKKMNEAKVQKFAKKNKIAKEAPASIIGNTYVVLYDDGYDDCNLFTTVEEGDNGTVVLKGLLEGLDISGTYNASTGKLTIPGSVVVGNNATYGTITLYASSGSSYYRDTPITGTVTETGITFDYGFMGGVSYNGGVGALYSVDTPEAFKSNGTFTASTATKTYSAPILVTKTADDEITVVGVNCALNGLMFTNGKDFGVNFNNVFTLDEAGMIATCPFEAFDNYGSYGDFKYGGIVGGYLDTLTFNISTSDNSSTLVCAGQSFYGYLNGQSYSGQTVTSATMTIDFDVFAAESGETTDPNEGWEDLGNATFMDGWVLTAFGINQFDKANWYEVPLQQNIENRNLYRLVDPYHQAGFPALQANESKKVGYIVFDVTDPDHVIVNLDQVEAGFANSTLGLSKFYCYNLLTAYSLIFEEDPSFVVEVFEDDLAYTTFKDGVISLSYYDDVTYGRQYDANFGYQNDPTGGYSWSDADDNSVDMSAMIIFPGATPPSEDIEVEGNMTTQVDMNMGQGEPDLTDPVTYDVTATYNPDTKKLTIYNFAELNPVVFDVDVENGTITAAEGQVSSIDDYEEDNILTYYYSDLATEEEGLNGTIRNLNDEQCELVIDNWGEAMNFPGYGMFFNTAFYNTTVTLDLNIEGVPYKPQISIESIEPSVNNDGTSIDLTITYDSSYLPDGAKVFAIVTGTYAEDDTNIIQELSGNPAVVTIPDATDKYHNYIVRLEVRVDEDQTVASAEKETGDFIVSGIDSIDADNNTQTRYFNLQGVEISQPENGVYIKVEGNKASKVLVK